MRYRKVLHYDAFSSTPNKGNPAGVVLDADDLDEESMQYIAQSVGFNETVFVLRSEKADVKLRYFTPGHEINLCGHATIAAMYCLKSLGMLHTDRNEIEIETNVGVLPIFFETRNGEHFITMKQDKPQFTEFKGSISKLAESIGITEEEIDATMPIVYGSTGTWTLLLPIKNVYSFSKMKPTNSMFPKILTQNSKASIHPFSLETVDENAFMHARHFSSPYSGTMEDAITGTASGVMGAYYLTYLNQDISEVNFLVEQGQEVGREGSVWVTVNRGERNMDVYVSGTGVYVREFEVSYALAEESI
ncbi:PhzF family phenazine biosynthesis isomerase [Paenibacillus polygoni]|uniref:PhzF family phenazine biosynthesis isomerase n=1 Tax=Paenibacillus polygoni TaxID=3050112 RepID=A0ABY8X5H9_9BACL|nr:PhzF family phenazine biosynthesis isomerase [Paenibacillus polygoni]WIV20308.1 PhzF family phenazine biosynthesis isomerase [Paenibacillus polygoni]